MPCKKGPRIWVHLYCQAKRKRWVKDDQKNMVEVDKKCNAHNYVTEKNKRNTTDRVELMKYCPLCKKHTPHKEGK